MNNNQEKTLIDTKEKTIKEQMIIEAIKKISTLADLKNIKINIEGAKETEITCDLKWQTEALSNIIKNAIEHSKENSNIDIIINSNKIYNEIKVINYDAYIDEEDQKHIFERFYKAKNRKDDSVGIGLALSKSIIEKDNGTIRLKSNKEKTEFSIKYFIKN
jgi:signal transduction histidine kinase